MGLEKKQVAEADSHRGALARQHLEKRNAGTSSRRSRLLGSAVVVEPERVEQGSPRNLGDLVCSVERRNRGSKRK